VTPSVFVAGADERQKQKQVIPLCSTLSSKERSLGSLEDEVHEMCMSMWAGFGSIPLQK
jgi:hypothetical protein